MSEWNDAVIKEFRQNEGKVAQFGDAPLVILHTIGAKSGEVREIPLVSLVQGEDVFVFASKAGATTQPDWLFNLRAHPEIEVETGSGTYRARAVELPEDQRRAALDAQAALMPQFGEYIVTAAPRLIPAIHLERV